jgi:murein DD-endopeptidase MepM/ murein hydrolase activator NlpD
MWSMVTVPFVIFLLFNLHAFKHSDNSAAQNNHSTSSEDNFYDIVDTVRSGDTLEAIFRRHDINIVELNPVLKASRDIYNLSRLKPGNLYSFKLDGYNNIRMMEYVIDDLYVLSVQAKNEGFIAEKREIPYTTKTGTLYVAIKNNLISSMPSDHPEYLKLALKLSDIFAWDIDFSNDIMENDSVKIVVEELWLGNAFKGFGDIFAVEFYNNGKLHRAYRFEYDGHTDYYDSNGKSLRKTLLRSPLRFKYVSSYFNMRRYHPILRVYRPHLGIDYAAPAGTPVSAAGDGRVAYVGYNRQYGRMIRIKHNGGFETYYGHLSRIPAWVRKGVKVSQGEIIGYVGSTGLATGPHLDYRIKLNGRFVNPLKIKLPRQESIPEDMMDKFKDFAGQMNIKLASLRKHFMAFSTKERALNGKI